MGVPNASADARLVASELITNALEHGIHGVVTVDVTAAEDRVTIAVTSANDGWRPPENASWALPDPEQINGRGLAFTSMLCDSVEVHRSDGVFGEPGCLAIVARVSGGRTS